MKKLFTLVAFVATVGFASAQSFKLIDIQGNEITNDSLIVTGADTITYPQDPPIKSRAFVINTSGSQKVVNVKRYLINVPGGVTEQFCFGILCFAPGTFVGDPAVPVSSNDTNKSFYGDIFPNGNAGNYTIRYVFFDTNNENDSVHLDVVFQVPVTGIEKFEKSVISNPYPNPAKDYTVFEYDLNSAKEGKVVIYDMAGNIVKEKAVAEAEGKLKITLDELNNGVYFYTFYANDKAISTKRLVIQK